MVLVAQSLGYIKTLLYVSDQIKTLITLFSLMLVVSKSSNIVLLIVFSEHSQIAP